MLTPLVEVRPEGSRSRLQQPRVVAIFPSLSPGLSLLPRFLSLSLAHIESRLRDASHVSLDRAHDCELLARVARASAGARSVSASPFLGPDARAAFASAARRLLLRLRELHHGGAGVHDDVLVTLRGGGIELDALAVEVEVRRDLVQNVAPDLFRGANATRASSATAAGSSTSSRFMRAECSRSNALRASTSFSSRVMTSAFVTRTRGAPGAAAAAAALFFIPPMMDPRRPPPPGAPTRGRGRGRGARRWRTEVASSRGASATSRRAEPGTRSSAWEARRKGVRERAPTISYLFRRGHQPESLHNYVYRILHFLEKKPHPAGQSQKRADAPSLHPRTRGAQGLSASPCPSRARKHYRSPGSGPAPPPPRFVSPDAPASFGRGLSRTSFTRHVGSFVGIVRPGPSYSSRIDANDSTLCVSSFDPLPRAVDFSSPWTRSRKRLRSRTWTRLGCLGVFGGRRGGDFRRRRTTIP